jgi:hypothetical protein
MSTVYDKLNAGSVIPNQTNQLGTLIKGSPCVVKVVVSADATGEKAVTIPYDMEVIDVVVQCTASNGSGSLQLKNGTAVTDAIACTTDKAIARAGTIDDAYSTLLTTSSVTVDANGASDRGIMWIIGYRI